MNEIDKLKGRELDRAVAERVMGWEVVGKRGDIYYTLASRFKDGTKGTALVPRWHFYIREAWEIVREMMEKGYGLEMSYDPELEQHKKQGFQVAFITPSEIEEFTEEAWGMPEEAICRAALKAKITEKKGNIGVTP